MNKSTKLDSVKKQKEILTKRLESLYDALEKPEAKKNEKVARFQLVLHEAEKEIEYINKHIERMEKSNGIKRQFIKGNVRKKFKESNERIANITRTVLVFKIDKGKDNLAEYEREMKDVHFRLDSLTEKLNENNERREFNQVLRQGSRIGRERPIEVIKEEQVDADAGKDTKISQSEKLLQDAN